MPCILNIKNEFRTHSDEIRNLNAEHSDIVKIHCIPVIKKN